MEFKRIDKIEACLRLGAVLLLVLTACLVGLDSQTKNLMYIEKEVTYKDLKALSLLVYVDSVAAGYNLLQLSRCSLSAWYKGNFKGSYTYLPWLWYLLDQLAVYITFAATCTAVEASILVVTGVNDFQWIKWCNKFTRFCFQIGGAIICGYVACVLMAFLSFISAFNLFRLYSPKRLFQLKTT